MAVPVVIGGASDDSSSEQLDGVSLSSLRISSSQSRKQTDVEAPATASAQPRPPPPRAHAHATYTTGPNIALTPAERHRKKELKARLRAATQRDYLERRVANAVKRKDAAMESAAREALMGWEEERTPPGDDDDGAAKVQEEGPSRRAGDGAGAAHYDYAHAAPDRPPRRHADPLVHRGWERVLSLYEALRREAGVDQGQRGSQRHAGAPPPDYSLPKHMRKGTQTRDMFAKKEALWGYVRLKFAERAGLVVESLARLNPERRDLQESGGGVPPPQIPPDQQASLRSELWERLLWVRSACSVGSGPGNDATGLVAFLRSVRDGDSDDDERRRPCLERLVLLDWTAREWREVTDPLSSVLVPADVRRGGIATRTCDVTEPLLRPRSGDRNTNSEALAALLLATSDGAESESAGTGESRASACDVDLFMISYLLTETHGRWTDFVSNLVDLAKTGALFYLAEPRPWQLHRLMEICHDRMEFVWLDSSMDDPALQALGTRVGTGSGGAAVLLGIKT